MADDTRDSRGRLKRRPVSHRRRFLIGLALAALLGVGLGAALLAGARTTERRERAERRAVVTLSALAAVVDRANGGGEPAAAAAPATGLGEAIPAPAPATPPAAPAAPAAPADTGGMGIGAEIAATQQQAQAPATPDAR